MVAALREGRLDPDDLIDDTGNVPADALYSGFYMLAPTTEIAQKATLLEHLWNDEFVEGFQAMAQWSRDHVPFPGAAFRELVGAARAGERAHERVDPRRRTARSTLERRARRRARRDGRARQRRAGGRHRARAAPRRRPRAARRAAPARRPRDVRDRPVGVQAHDAAPDRVDRGPQRRAPTTKEA